MLKSESASTDIWPRCRGDVGCQGCHRQNLGEVFNPKCFAKAKALCRHWIISPSFPPPTFNFQHTPQISSRLSIPSAITLVQASLSHLHMSPAPCLHVCPNPFCSPPSILNTVCKINIRSLLLLEPNAFLLLLE